MISWIYLFLAGLLEMGWPLGFKLATLYPQWKNYLLSSAVLAIAASIYLLFLAQKEIPISTAYVFWTGVGGVGTFLIGVFIFKEPASFLRISCIMLIIAGLIGLKLAK